MAQAAALGTALGYGIRPLQDAIAAADSGHATPHQQMMLVAFIRALVEPEPR